MTHVIEAEYPLTFRAQDAQALGTHLRHHNSVALVGMKRVGISNFLRFFLNHPQVIPTYIGEGEHVFVVVDLNNLVEKKLYAFWTLTLKRVLDTIEASNLSETMKETCRATFTQSIQLSDLFFTIEAVHKLVSLLVAEGKYVTLFFLRFDRLSEVITPEFFANLQGLRDTAKNLSYVFTTYRPLSELVPTVFTPQASAGIVHDMYLQPARAEDVRIVLSTFQTRYDLNLPENMIKELLHWTDGHVQYLQLSLLQLKSEAAKLHKPEHLRAALLSNEQIAVLSEELWASLTSAEQAALTQLSQGEAIKDDKTLHYLFATGMVNEGAAAKRPPQRPGLAPGPQARQAAELAQPQTLFSPLFADYVAKTVTHPEPLAQDFTKKEHLLYALLQAHQGELVERETIIEAVWPDEVELGVSDWSIDRLVSRVRAKLKVQQSPCKIVTVITRGYKLVTSQS